MHTLTCTDAKFCAPAGLFEIHFNLSIVDRFYDASNELSNKTCHPVAYILRHFLVVNDAVTWELRNKQIKLCLVSSSVSKYQSDFAILIRRR